MDILAGNFMRPWKASVHSFVKASEYVPGTVLSAGKTAVTKIDTISCSNAASVRVEETDDEQVNKRI